MQPNPLENLSKILTIWARVIKIWAKPKPCILKNIRSPTTTKAPIAYMLAVANRLQRCIRFERPGFELFIIMIWLASNLNYRLLVHKAQL